LTLFGFQERAPGLPELMALHLPPIDPGPSVASGKTFVRRNEIYYRRRSDLYEHGSRVLENQTMQSVASLEFAPQDIASDAIRGARKLNEATERYGLT